MKTLIEIFNAYVDHLKLQNPNQKYPEANLKTALVKYTLPGWGLKKDATTQEAVEFMAQVPIHQFKNAIKTQEDIFSELGDNISGATRRTYRMHLKKFIDWCKRKTWWKQEYEDGTAKYAPRLRTSQGMGYRAIKLTNRKANYTKPFRLKETQITETLKEEFNKLVRFLVSPSVRKRQDEPIRKLSAESYLERLRGILGWLHNVKKVPLEQITLNLLDDMDLTYDFLDWLRTERGAVARTEFGYLLAFLSVAKYLHHKESNSKGYTDIEIIRELRELTTATNKRANQEPKVADESKKWLDWDKFLAAVEILKQECAARRSNYEKRSDSAIATSHQRYLMAAFLAYMPPERQRTLRELEVGRTLIKEGENWFLKLGIDDYKTGKTYGEQITPVPKLIYPELEAWLSKWREVFKPEHNFVFTQRNGKPFNSRNLSCFFSSAMFRLTGQIVTPHLVRAMAITHFQRNGATDAQMEALALGMKHSRKMQQSVYDHRTQQEKIAPAIDMMLGQKSGVLHSAKQPIK